MDEESLLTNAETICLNAYQMKIFKGFLKVLLDTFKKERALVVEAYLEYCVHQIYICQN